MANHFFSSSSHWLLSTLLQSPSKQKLLRGWRNGIKKRDIKKPYNQKLLSLFLGISTTADMRKVTSRVSNCTWGDNILNHVYTLLAHTVPTTSVFAQDSRSKIQENLLPSYRQEPKRQHALKLTLQFRLDQLDGILQKVFSATDWDFLSMLVITFGLMELWFF